MPPPAKRPASRSALPSKRSSGGGGGFWLVVCLLMIGVAATFLFAPDFTRKLLGLAQTPAGRGQEPAAPENMATNLNQKDHKADTDLDKSMIDRASLARKAADDQKAATTKIDTTPKVFPDEDKAKGYLAEAEKAYKKYEWNKAAQIAHKIDNLTVTPATRVRARDIANGTIALEKLFTDLNDKDELFRYYDTHPSLVVLKTGNSTSLAVPIVSLDQQAPVEANPLGWIASQRKNGKVSFMLKGKKDFIATVLPADTIGEVEAADLPAIIKEKQAEFASRLNRLKNSVLAGNALAWYDAGKFAFRNRLDDQVTEMMDQALLLDHNLVRSVREDKAASLFANVVLHMRNGNQKQADAFMAIIGRRFSDTDQGKQARLFYDGKTSELLTAAKEAEKRRIDEVRERNEARLARAKELNDETQVQQLQQAVAKAEEPEIDNSEPDAPLTTGDEAVADTAFSKGRDLYNKAIDFGNTPERDAYYEKAYNELHQARAIYSKLVDKSPNDEKLQMKLLECNKLHYGSIKQRRFH